MAFLPRDSKEPVSVSNYMKWADGSNTFRVLSDAITGNTAWVDEKGNVKPRNATTGGNYKPQRFHENDDIPSQYAGETRYFWAFIVYNRELERIQILEITQVSIRKAISALMKSPKWGDPHEYDLMVTKTGEGMETEYSIMPEPKEEIEDSVAEVYRNAKIDLEALFTGEDPFTGNEQNLAVKATTEAKKSSEDKFADDVNLDEVPF